MNTRPIVTTDIALLRRMAEQWWRLHLSVPLESLPTKLGVLAEDAVGMRGFLLIDPQANGIGLIVAAGLRDSWGVAPYLKALLPHLETLPAVQNLTALLYVGDADWLVEPLQNKGFQTQAWVMTLERKTTFPLDFVGLRNQHGLLRPATPTDLAKVVALDRLAFDQLWHKIDLDFAGCINEADPTTGAAHLVNVAELDGQIIGYVWCEMYDYHAHFNRLAVHPAHQGQGIGSQLLAESLNQAIVLGATRLTLNTQEENYRSRALYRRFGFEYTQRHIPVLWKKTFGA